jgi:hypothetical protein
MPVKKTESHDCKTECAELHRQLASLKKEVASLKAELKKAPKGGGKDPRVDQLIEVLKGFHLHGGLVTKDIVKHVNNSENILKSI